MDNSKGCLALPWSFVSGGNGIGAPPPLLPPTISRDSIEIFAMREHGRTSFVWSMVFMLRQLSRVWPGYLCWPVDETTGHSLVAIHENLQAGHLPEAWGSQDNGSGVRYTLHLRNLNPWGERYFVVSDHPDTVFGPQQEDDSSSSGVNWNLPALWLLSLVDLDEVQGRFLDLTLDQIIRARNESGEVAREWPFRLVIVLTKGDAIPDLPPELRCFLKQDPLAKALANSTGGLFRPHDELDLSPPPNHDRSQPYPVIDPIHAYFEARDIIDQLILDWMRSNSVGRALLGRAEDMNVELKFSLVSATGSGVTSEGNLATSWSPRRVLDPYFWCLEMGA